VIFVSIDTLSARHLDLHGYARETAPNLTRFAAEGIVFERCWANATWTTPSYMSQWTGLLPWAHRVERDGDVYPCQLARARVTLAESLRAAGYRTAAFIDNPNLSPTFGFAQGFEVYDLSAALIDKRDHSGGARKVFADGLAWLEGLAGQRSDGAAPAFLMLQVLDVHGPYAPTPPYRGAFAGDGLGAEDRDVPVGLGPGSLFGAAPHYVATPPGADEPPESVSTAALADAYDEEILQLDAALGELFDELRASGRLDDAIVIVSADHGESLVEHDSLFSHDLPYESVAHVPLIVRLPGGRDGGRRVATPVQLIDLYPTLLELAGDAPQPGLHGRSLVPALAGGELAPVPIFCQGDLFGVQAVDLDGAKLIEMTLSPALDPLAFASYPPVRAWFEERFPILEGRIPGTTSLALEEIGSADLTATWAEAEAAFGHPRHELYRTSSDPGELLDLALAEPSDVELRASLLAFARRRTEAARIVPGGDETQDLDPESRRALKALGYVDGSGR
jgi:arylsulfatase A-like enzyme